MSGGLKVCSYCQHKAVMHEMVSSKTSWCQGLYPSFQFCYCPRTPTEIFSQEENKVKVYHKTGGCAVCQETRPHWHETDPRPIDMGYAQAPVDVEGLRAYVWQKSSPEARDAYIVNGGTMPPEIEKLSEPAPIFQIGTSHVVWPTLYTYIKKRVERGLEKYAQHLSTHDGRDGMHDALDEAIDLCFYLTKVVMEEEDKRINASEIRREVENDCQT